MFERKDNKETALLDLDGRANNVSKRYAAIRAAGDRIEAMVKVRDNLRGAERLNTALRTLTPASSHVL